MVINPAAGQKDLFGLPKKKAPLKAGGRILVVTM